MQDRSLPQCVLTPNRAPQQGLSRSCAPHLHQGRRGPNTSPSPIYIRLALTSVNEEVLRCLFQLIKCPLHSGSLQNSIPGHLGAEPPQQNLDLTPLPTSAKAALFWRKLLSAAAQAQITGGLHCCYSCHQDDTYFSRLMKNKNYFNIAPNKPPDSAAWAHSIPNQICSER